MNVLVTGGAGFIGSHVADAFIARGDSVIILDNLSAGSLENVNPQAHFVEGDIRPSGHRTFQQLARVLETGDISLYKPTDKPNTQWSHWPEGGTL